MLLCQTSRPSARREILQSFGLADAGEWLTQNSLDDLEGPQRDSAISLDPIAEVLAELGLEYGYATALRDHKLLFSVDT